MKIRATSHAGVSCYLLNTAESLIRIAEGFLERKHFLSHRQVHFAHTVGVLKVRWIIVSYNVMTDIFGACIVGWGYYAVL